MEIVQKKMCQLKKIIPTRFQLLILICLTELAPFVTAGTCWLTVNNVSARCQHMLAMGMSKEECCSGGRASAGWTPHDDVTSGKLFYWRALAGGAPECVPCQETCDNVQCPADKRCKIRNRRPKCVCSPDCSSSTIRHRGAICGSDGRTYRNHCAMLKYNCRHTTNVKVDYVGTCQRDCDDVECSRHKHCIHDQNGLPHCVHCGSPCPPGTDDSQTICGADGVTYDTTCHFRRATCLHGRSIGIAYTGRCRDDMTCALMRCPWGTRCLTNINGGQPQCISCERPCPVFDVQSGPICGTNNVTYANWCVMRQSSCEISVVINTKHYGECTSTGLPPAPSIEYYDVSTERDSQEDVS